MSFPPLKNNNLNAQWNEYLCLGAIHKEIDTYCCFNPETLAETIESGPLCITDLFQNKSVAYY